MSVTHLNLFPTTIGIKIDKELTTRLFPIARKILDKPENLTFQWGYKNTYGIPYRPNGELEFLAKYLKNLGNEHLSSLGFKSLDLTPEIFFSEMLLHDSHGKHEHPNSILSGVVYLKVSENSSLIRFHDPRPVTKFTKLSIERNTENTWEYYDILPEEGMILIWHSWLTHEVLKNITNDGRITAVFNLNLG
jgi:uncharacterized protein (DUF2249 family)